MEYGRKERMTFAVGFEIFHNSMPKPKEMMATFGIRTEDVAMKITARIADIVAAEVTYHFEIISAITPLCVKCTKFKKSCGKL